MTTAPVLRPRPETHPLLTAESAASDGAADQAPSTEPAIEEAPAWDSHRVWKIFIRDARERRERGYS